MRDKQLLAQNLENVLKGRLLYCILAFLGCSCEYNERGSGWGDNCKIRVARREFVYIVLSLLIAKAGLGGILQNRKPGGEICCARAYELSNVKLQNCEKSHELKNQAFLIRSPRITILQHQERPVITHPPSMLFANGSTHWPKGRSLYIRR